MGGLVQYTRHSLTAMGGTMPAEEIDCRKLSAVVFYSRLGVSQGHRGQVYVSLTY